MKIWKKIVLMSLSIFLLTVVAAGVYGNSLLGFSLRETSKTFKSLDDNDDSIQPIDATEPLTILLMGVDMDQASRGGQWDGGRSDSMILVILNPTTNTTTMMSLTRDIMVEIAEPDGTSSGTIDKLNHSYSYGQAPMAIATIEKMMDITINRYVEINMDGLVELVDALGGIEVNNTLGFPISISEYEPVYTAVVPEGKTLVNGNQALVYSRMRYDDPEGDIGRQKRQREVITAIVKKILNLDGLTQYKKILTTISNNMRTNIEITTSTIPSLLGYKDALSNLEPYQLQGEEQMINELSYQLPTSEHLLEMQNVLKASTGQPTATDLVTNVQVNESMMYLPSPVNVYNAYTNELVLEASPWAQTSTEDSTTYDTTAEMNSETTATDTYSSEGE